LIDYYYFVTIAFTVVVIPMATGRVLIVVATLQCVSCTNQDGCSRSYGLSTNYLGLNYEVLVWPPSNHSESEASFSIVAATSTSTNVRVQFPSWQDNCVITFRAIRLDCGQTLDFTLSSMQTATFRSTTTDLSGTLVEASMPVAVYADNSRITIGPGNVNDSTSEQLFPISSWGREFVVAPIPDNSQSGYSIRVSCGSAGNVSVAVDGVEYELNMRRPLTVDFGDNRPTYVNVVSAGALQLMQFVRGATVATDRGAPAALTVPAVERFTHTYTMTPDDAFTEYMSIVARRSDVSGLRLNGLPLSVTWLDVGSSGWVTAAVPLMASETDTLEHTGQKPFGAYSYGYTAGHCAFAYPTGASLPLQVYFTDLNIAICSPHIFF